ncbi:MAG: aminotransferase class V-fold PLP-dependent enzyme [Actinomycetota bacterium]|nr:aminotransferase class V-fold PLP-dependent enzyme [Actinomycetota bacterium]
MDVAHLRGQFPVLGRLAYLNAGTDGPVPAAAVTAAHGELQRQERDGRWQAHFERRMELAAMVRASYAAVLHCDPADVALTTSTTEGVSIVVTGLALGPDDEVLTSDEEHPGLLGALQAARDLRGVRVRTASFAALADDVGPRTRLVACSHVSWLTGARAPAGLSQLDVPVLLDGAQGVGAVPTDVRALGAAFYAGAGQKWLCGPDGSGMLYVAPEVRERLTPTRRGYLSFERTDGGLDSPLHRDARRYDAPALPAESLAFAAAALGVLGEAGWDAVHARGRVLAARLCERLREQGREVVSPGDTTLVSFGSPEPGECLALSRAGVVVRELPGRPWLRASVGAWNDEADIERLVAALG